MSQVDLSVITVTHNSRDYVADCILSVILHTLHITHEHIIVDNGSEDDTVSYLKEYFPHRIQLIEAGQNIGFAKGNELGLKHAKGRYILYLNPDMKLIEGSLDAMIAWMDTNTDIGLSTCRLITQDKTHHPFLRPTKLPTLLTFVKSVLGFIPFSVSLNRDTIYEEFEDDQEQDIKTARGAFFLARRSLHLSFDTAYFLLLEDLDLCRQVESSGYRVTYYPHISCIDYYNRSFSKVSSSWYYLVGTRSMNTYISKWYSPLHSLWFVPFRILGFLIRIPKWGIIPSFSAYKNYRTCILHQSITD